MKLKVPHAKWREANASQHAVAHTLTFIYNVQSTEYDVDMVYIIMYILYTR